MKWSELQTVSHDDLKAWAETQSWCEQMSQCFQDSEWHSEGDVWTHTQMVLDQLPLLNEWNELSPTEQQILKFTAMFHDVAKPHTTETDSRTGKVTAPKHALKGSFLARNILRDLNCDLRTREEIVRLVRFHGRPVFVLEKEIPEHEVIKFSWLLQNRLLYLFALADHRGRTTVSSSRSEETLHFWKLLAEEQNCYSEQYPFQTDHARFMFFRMTKPNPYYVPHEDFSCQVTMMSGLPGVGKNTWLSQNRAELPSISLDEIRRELKIAPTENQGRVAQAAEEACRELLRSGTSFAFNATNTMALTRRRWIELFSEYRARIEIVYLEPSFKTIFQQNQSRQAAVPEKVICKLAEKLDPPTWEECHNLIYVDS